MTSIQWQSFNVTAIYSYFGNTKWPEDDYFGTDICCFTCCWPLYMVQTLASVDSISSHMHSLTFWRRNYFFNFSTPVYKI